MAMKVETTSVKMSDVEGRNDADADVLSRLLQKKKMPSELPRQVRDPMRLLCWLAFAFLFSVVIVDQWRLQGMDDRLRLLEQHATTAAAAGGGDAQHESVAGRSQISYVGNDETSAEIQENTDNSQHELRILSEEKSDDVTDDITDDVIETASSRRRRSAEDVQSDGPATRVRHGDSRQNRQSGGGTGRGTRKPPRDRPKTPATDPHSAAFHMEFHIHMTEEERQLCHDGKSNITLSNGGVCRPVGYSLNAFSSSDVYRTWRPAEWARTDASKNYYVYDQRTGQLTVQQSGIYNVYAQILYHNSANRMGYAVMVDDEPYMKCWSSVDVALATSSLDNSRYKTCHVGAAVKLNKLSKVWIKDLYGHPVVIDPHSSYFGIIKVADVQDRA